MKGAECKLLLVEEFATSCVKSKEVVPSIPSTKEMHKSIIVLHCNSRFDFLLPGCIGVNSGEHQRRVYKATHQFALTLIGGRIRFGNKAQPYADRRIGSGSANRNCRPDICSLQPVFGPILMTLNLRNIKNEHLVPRT